MNSLQRIGDAPPQRPHDHDLPVTYGAHVRALDALRLAEIDEAKAALAELVQDPQPVPRYLLDVVNTRRVRELGALLDLQRREQARGALLLPTFDLKGRCSVSMFLRVLFDWIYTGAR